MGIVYFTRHGESVWNVENKICGATDIPLTEAGRDQAFALGEFIRNEEIAIDEILCSPLSRTVETAKIISDITGIPYREEDRLTEQALGRFEGAPRDSEEFFRDRHHFVDSMDGGETTLHVVQRVYNLLDEVKAESDKKTCLLVGHSGIFRVFESYFRDMTNDELGTPGGLGNCELLKREFR